MDVMEKLSTEKRLIDANALLEKLDISQEELKNIQSEAAKTVDRAKKSENKKPERNKKKKDFVIKNKNSAFGAALMKALGDGKSIITNEDGNNSEKNENISSKMNIVNKNKI